MNAMNMNMSKNKNNAASAESKAANGTIGAAPILGDAANGQTGLGATVVSVGSSRTLFGLGGIIDALLLVCAWGVVGIGYICVPGSLVAAVLGFACAAMNVCSGMAATALCAGVGAACVGLCYPIFVGTRALRGMLLRREGKVSLNAKLLAGALIVAAAGAAVAGIATLAGAGDALTLPAFLQAVLNK